MANEEQLSILRQGVKVWNKWREENKFQTTIDLIEADLNNANLEHADLSKANLTAANLKGAHLKEANLHEANLVGANLSMADLTNAYLVKVKLLLANLYLTNFHAANFEGTNLDKTTFADTIIYGANLSDCSLRETDFRRANLIESNLSRADLTGAYMFEAMLNFANLTDVNLEEADLTSAKLIEANLIGGNLKGINLEKANLRRSNLTNANLTSANLTNSNLIETIINNAKISNCSVYGVNVWDLAGEFKEQKDLIITPEEQSKITVDNVEVAQFIYLILNNKKIRGVINTLTSKSVLILGRFSIPERKGILDALRNKLRQYDLLPIVFDFDRPTNKDFTETIKTLASISYFVIADVTNPKSSPLELQATVPDYQIPFVPIIQEGESPFAMMVDLQKKYPWVLPTRSYNSIETLMSALKSGIIDPAVEMRNKLRLVKAQEQVTESLRDYVDKSL